MLKKLYNLWSEFNRPIPLENNFSNYDDYWINRGFHAPSISRAKLISPYITKNSRVLDIGCGDGTMMEYIKEKNQPQTIEGIDISAKAVEFVVSKGLNASVVDIMSDNFNKFLENKEFDDIIITEVLEHIPDPEKVISILRSHGNKNLFVSVPNAGFFIHRLRFLFGRFPLVMIVQHVKEHIRFWTKKDFIYWAKYHGYNVEKIIVINGLYSKKLAFLENLFPGLFANQIIYKLKIKK